MPDSLQWEPEPAKAEPPWTVAWYADCDVRSLEEAHAMTTSGSAPRSTPLPTPPSGTILFRERWALPLGQTKIEPTQAGGRIPADLVRVHHRFNGGMVYEVRGQRHLLVERTFGDYPFLIVLRLRPGKSIDFTARVYDGVPEAVMGPLRAACEAVPQRLTLPKNFHNIEADVTALVNKTVKLPAGWRLAKVILKVPLRSHVRGVACDCDVDGPCGYCCDTCDSCYLCC